MSLLWLLAGWFTALVISIVPAFMPPMWLVLSAFRVGADVPLLALTLGAAVTGAAGRAILALVARSSSSHLPESTQRDSAALGDWFRRRGRVKWLAVAAYCLGPFPSNVLFIAAGMSGVSIRAVAVIYALTRAVSDTFWVWTASNVIVDVQDAFAGPFTDWMWVVAQVIGLLAIAALFRLPWSRWLQHHD